MFRALSFDMLSSSSFVAKYRCYAVENFPDADRSDLNKGGKILLPPSALETLTRYHIIYPMLFQLRNPATERTTHAGVLEFIAEEGKVYLPAWLMRNLNLLEGDEVDITNKTLPIATYSKFQPQSVDFLDITNPKAVLENTLRNFACLTKGDIIAIDYNKKIYELLVMETKPTNAVSIIECDMNVEFETPLGYEEAQQAKEEHVPAPPPPPPVEFTGMGQRLDGKPKKPSQLTENVQQSARPVRGIPDYDFEPATLSFDRSITPISDRVVSRRKPNESADAADGFTGAGASMS